MNETTRRRILSATYIVGFFVVWELLCLMFHVSTSKLPRPSQILITLWNRFPAIWPHALQTLYTTLVGFGLGIIIGILLGMLIGSSRLAYDVAYPMLVGFSSIPKVAVVPIFVLWFGAGTVPAMLTAMIMCIFPIVVNVATGLAATEPELQDVMKTLRATKFEILWNVGLPRTMPYFFASLKVAVTLAFVGTVISETVASNRGIGNLMMIASSSFDVPLVFAGLFILAALGVGLYAAFSLIEGRVTGWAVRSDNLLPAAVGYLESDIPDKECGDGSPAHQGRGGVLRLKLRCSDVYAEGRAASASNSHAPISPDPWRYDQRIHRRRSARSPGRRHRSRHHHRPAAPARSLACRADPARHRRHLAHPQGTDGRACLSSRCPAASAPSRNLDHEPAVRNRQTGGLLDIAGFFASFLGFIDHLVETKFRLPASPSI